MLASLTVQNFAIISNINIEFDKGLTILTGETGAGKSLIIDAIGLLFGNRASTSMIRSGCTKAIVEGVFIDCGSKVMDIIKKFKKDNEITEDEQASYEKDIQKTLDSYIAKIDNEMSLKEKDLMSV